MWGPSRGNPMAPTAPGPKMACTRAASTAYWRQRSRRGVEPMRGPGATRGKDKQDQTEMTTEDETGQCPLLACSTQEDDNEERIPPERLRTLNVCGHQRGEGGGGPLTQQHRPTSRSQETEGEPLTWQRAPQARGRRRKDEGGAPIQ